MRITVKFASLFKIYAGIDQDEVELPAGTTVDQLTLALNQKYQNLPFDSSQTFYVVNDKIATKGLVLADGDEVRIFQTLAGG